VKYVTLMRQMIDVVAGPTTVVAVFAVVLLNGVVALSSCTDTKPCAPASAGNDQIGLPGRFVEVANTGVAATTNNAALNFTIWIDVM
jgi:predicted lipoprotein